MKSATNLSRRKFGGLAIASTALAAATPLRAMEKKPAPAAITPGLFQATIGQYTVTSILDGMIPMGRELFSGPEQEIDAVLAETGQTGQTIPGPISAFLLSSEQETILIDSGFGALDMFGPGFGNLSAGLSALGVTPSQIDKVILTHAHPDHIGGMLSADGSNVFANAEVIITEKEFTFWNDQAIMSQAPESALGIFQLAQQMTRAYGDQITRVESGKEIAAGIQLDVFSGHTPGHGVLTIDGGDIEVKMIAEALHNAELHTRLPGIKFAFDLDPEQAVVSRVTLFDQLAADKSLVLGSHLHFPGYGRILRDGKAYRYSAASV